MTTESQSKRRTTSLSEQQVDRHASFNSSHASVNSSDNEDVNDDDNNMKIKPIIKEGGGTASRNSRYNKLQELLIELQRRFPYLQKAVAKFKSIPPRYRLLFVVFWVLSKFVIMFLLFYVVGQTHSWTQSFRTSNVGSSSSSSSTASIRDMHVNGLPYHFQSQSQQSQSQQSQSQQSKRPIKILYIVTSLAEFDSGKRATVKGKDRLGHVLLPVLVDNVESMTTMMSEQQGSDSTSSAETSTTMADTTTLPLYQVDVYLILAYQLTPDRRAEIRNRLPATVGLQIWDDSCPLGYDRKSQHPDQIRDNTRALARNHRLVIKDKLPYYDLFLAWEDDMRVTGPHVQQFLQQTHALDILRAQAPATLPDVPEPMDPSDQKFFGAMTKQQLDRLIPGFVRVEVLLNATEHGAQLTLDPIPLDYQFAVTKSDSDNHNTNAADNTANVVTTTTTQEERHFDPQPCCQVHMSPNDETPVHPDRSDVVVWETSIKALSARQLPASSAHEQTRSLLDWVVLLPGPGKRLPKDQLMGGYWSGRDGAFGDEIKPSPGMPDLIAQQGGWMATREQIMRLHTAQCQGAFVPPFDEPIYRADGQESMNVEFYSGGYQFFTGVLGGCNMQRIVSLHPDHFSKHFVYHVANNKQRQLAARRMVQADHLFGQLNTVQKRAEQAKASMLSTSSNSQANTYKL
jgi:hypothetical protein